MTELWAIVPALDLVDLTLQTCLDLLAQSTPTRVLLIDQGSSEESNDQFRQFAEQHHPRVLLWSFTVPPPSLSAAWNLGLGFVWGLSGEEALVCNNDIRLAPEMARLLHAARLNTGAWFVSGVGVGEDQFAAGLPDSALGELTERGGPDFSCFLVSRAGHWIYPFDEGFIPAFSEDCDCHRRYMLGGDGARIFSVNLPFYHIGGGSRTINQSDAARQRFERQAGIGRAHYVQKWGGPPNQERFTVAFAEGSAQDWVTNPELQARVQAGIPVLETGQELTDSAAIGAILAAGAILHAAAPTKDDIPF